MIPFVVKRIAGAAVVVVLVSMIAFGLTSLVPGDPALTIAGENATRDEVAAVHTQLGLDEPLVTRYLTWAGHALRGDLGTSLFSTQPVTEIVAERLPVTLSLALLAMLVAVLIAVPCGIAAALRPGSRVDRVIGWLSSLAVAIPSFWLGLMLILLLAIALPVFPATGGLILPAITLGLAAAVEPLRQLRTSLVRTMNTDYIRTARAKGLLPGTILRKHAIRNAAVPCLTVIGLEAGQLLGGAVIVETVFGLPGLGTLAELTVTRQDLPVLQGIVLVSAVVVVLVTLVVDLVQRRLEVTA